MAVVMDGNGCRATERGLSRTAGRRAGAEAVSSVVDAAPGEGVRLLTCGDDLARAVAGYRGRHRRFGAVADDRTATISEDSSCKTYVAS